MDDVVEEVGGKSGSVIPVRSHYVTIIILISLKVNINDDRLHRHMELARGYISSWETIFHNYVKNKSPLLATLRSKLDWNGPP